MHKKIVALLLGLFLFVFADSAGAEPKYEVTKNGIRVVVYDEDCRLDAIKNLKWKAVWFENGKEIEGCAGAKDEYEVVIIYFADKTIAVIPMFAFRRLSST